MGKNKEVEKISHNHNKLWVQIRCESDWWYWIVYSAGSRKVAVSENSYSEQKNAIRGVRRFLELWDTKLWIPIVVLDERGDQVKVEYYK